MDRDDVTSLGLTAIGIVAGTVARAVALGGRLVAAGLETVESALRGADDAPAGRPEQPYRPLVPTSEPAARSSFAPVSEPAFEPADGVTAPARPARTVTRRSSADAAARATPGPRPAKRATAKSLPPNLRPVEPVEATADASEKLPTPTATKAAATAKKSTATKATAKKASAKKATAKKAAAPVKGAQGAADVPPSDTAPARKTARKTTGKAPAKGTAGAPDAAGDGSPAS